MSGRVELATPDIERVLAAARAGELGAVLTAEGLARAHLGALASGIAGLIGVPVETAVHVLAAVREERLRPAATRVSLVWTGPETRGSGARDTAVVVREMFEASARHVRDVVSELRARTRFEGASIRDGHDAPRDRQHAAFLKLRHGPRDRLAAGADHLADGLVRQLLYQSRRLTGSSSEQGCVQRLPARQ